MYIYILYIYIIARLHQLHQVLAGPSNYQKNMLVYFGVMVVLVVLRYFVDFCGRLLVFCVRFALICGRFVGCADLRPAVCAENRVNSKLPEFWSLVYIVYLIETHGHETRNSV